MTIKLTRTEVARRVSAETGIDLRAIARRMAGLSVHLATAKVVDEALAKYGVSAPESGVIPLATGDVVKGR